MVTINIEGLAAESLWRRLLLLLLLLLEVLSADAADSLEQTPTTGHYPPHCITVVPDSLILLIDEGGPLPGRPLHKSEQLLIDLINVRY